MTPLTVFDLGLFDGADTEYYLENGWRVVAVEPNPKLLQRALRRFDSYIESSRLTCIHGAIAEVAGTVVLQLNDSDLGSSTVIPHAGGASPSTRLLTVPGITMDMLMASYGIPYYLKVDVEGADRFAVLALTPATRPRYLSFEAGPDAEELITHAERIGYTGFKIISQTSFREVATDDCLQDRAARRLMRALGYASPRLVRRGGRFFVVGRSSGPVPWRTDGHWRTAEAARSIWRHGVKSPKVTWYDIHATSEGSRVSS